MRRGSTYRPSSPQFGSWLLSEIRAAGMNQGEFADRVGVSRTTVSRWVHGRVPDGVFIDPIADVLTLPYDVVSERAGYRPALPDEALDAIHARLDPHLRKVLDNDNALDTIEIAVRSIVAGIMASGRTPASAPAAPSDQAAPASPARPARSR